MDDPTFVIGVDFGTDSVRTLIVDAAGGTEIAAAVAPYRRWAAGRYCDPVRNRFRQHPLDYVEGLEESITTALGRSPSGTARRVRGISVDTTGSTPAPVDRAGTPLALTPGFEENPDAMFILWKDHTAVDEAEEINRLAKSWGGVDYTMYEGGVYSSEWFWAKILHVLRSDLQVRPSAFSWVEHCDWIPALLTGCAQVMRMKRSRCAAGHKAMWHEAFDGLPGEEFLTRLDPLLEGLRSRLYRETFTSDAAAGTLSGPWAKRLGLPEQVTVGVGAFDAHMGAVGGGIRPYVLTKIMGTSTCDMLVAPMHEMEGKLIRGICGQVNGSILPGMLGMEAGQSAFGDVYAWFRDLLMWPVTNMIAAGPALTPEASAAMKAETESRLIAALSAEAAKTPVEASGVLALDWMNGRRTPDANQALKGAITGINLGTDAPRVFRALVEATAFGAKMIVDRFCSEGVRIDGVIALGGVARKSPFIMQVVSDVLNLKISVPRSEETCALGAAMCAAAACGIYPSIESARTAMESGFETEYLPNPVNARAYEALFDRYRKLGSFVEQETIRLRSL